MHGFLDIGSVVVNFSVFFGAGVVAGQWPECAAGLMGKAHVVAGGAGGECGAVGVITRRRVDVVLVDVSELLVHGVVIERLALVGLFLLPEIARVHQLPVSLVGDHGVAPPVRHRSQVVVVVVCNCIPHLHSYIVHSSIRETGRINII